MASDNVPNGRNAPEKFIREHLGEDALEDSSDESNGEEWQSFY